MKDDKRGVSKPTEHKSFVMMDVGAIGDCKTCLCEDCPNHVKGGGSGVNPIIHPEESVKIFSMFRRATVDKFLQPVAAYVKVYSTRDLDYEDLNNIRCSVRPMIFQESRSKLAIFGEPKPRETVLILRSGGVVSNLAGGVIIRVERGAFDEDWDDAMCREPNTIDSTGILQSGGD